MGCLIPNCTNDTRSRYTHKAGRICEIHWRHLPMAFRLEYWRQTEYGKLEIPEELATQIREYYNANTGKLS